MHKTFPIFLLVLVWKFAPVSIQIMLQINRLFRVGIDLKTHKINYVTDDKNESMGR